MKISSLFLQVFSVLTVVLNFHTAGAAAVVNKSDSTLQLRQKTKARNDDRNGLYIESVYANVNSQSKQYDIEHPEQASAFSEANPERPMNGIGLGVGYRRIKVRSFGFDVGGQVTQESNQLGGSYPAVYQVLANLNYSFIPQFYGYVGPNFTYVDSKGNSNDNQTTKNSTAKIGGQIGGGYLFKGFSIKLGYQVIQYELQNDYVTTLGDIRSFKTEGAGSGLITQIVMYFKLSRN